MSISNFKIEVQNIDSLYSFIKEQAESLQLRGWDAKTEGVIFSNSTLFDFFKQNLKEIKKGCDNLVVAIAYGEAEYSSEPETIKLSSHPTPLGLLVQITVEKFEESGCGQWDGSYSIEFTPETHVFLLKLAETSINLKA